MRLRRKLKRYFKAISIRALAPVGSFPTKLTDDRLLRSLVRRLAPVSTAHGLIRLGPDGDGGYLVPDDLDGIEACFSPGVSTESGFEMDCAERGMRVFLADRSVSAPAAEHPRFHFTPRFVGALTDDDFVTMDRWVAASVEVRSGDLILQMDIEGWEYEALLAVSDTLQRSFRILVIEFHHLDQLWNRAFYGLASRVFERLLLTHACVHIHPNNCAPPLVKGGLAIPPIAEFTFLRRDRLRNPEPATAFPHHLDYDNTDKPHYPLPECWYR